MPDCTAKVTTADVTDEVMAEGHEEVDRQFPRLLVDLYDVPDNATVQRQGDRLVRVDLHELSCDDHLATAPTPEPAHRCLEPWAEWTDDTPGATPHEDVTVSDAEVEAFVRTYYGKEGEPVWRDPALATIREALLAVKRAEKEQS